MARVRLVVLAGLLLAVAGVLHAQDEAGPPPAGAWKVVLPTLEGAEGRPVLLIRFTKGKAGAWKGEILASKLRGKTELTRGAVTAKAFTFSVKTPALTIDFDVRLGDPKATKLFGEATLRRDVMPVELERTTMTALEEFDQLREQLAAEPLGMRAAQIARILLADAEEKKVKPTEARAWAEKAVKSAQLYGPTVTREELLLLARTLAAQKGFESIALEYARRAERGLDEKAEGPVATKRVLDVLATVLERAGKKEEAASVQGRIKKLEFRVKPAKLAGRKAKSDRVILAEVFTTSQAKSCVAADMAIAALQKTFKPTELAIVVYHQHFPAGDPLGSPEGEERLTYYGKNVQTLPTLVFNGKLANRGGGGPEDAQDRYDTYVETIEPLLEMESPASLSVSATRKGDKVDITAEVSKLEEPGEDVRLRVVLVEAETAYRGGSGSPVHYNVARAMPGGFEGTPLKTKSAKKTYSIDIAELRKKLEKYQAEVDKKRAFADKERPLDLKKLRVIAFIQNDATNEVLQAAEADVTGQ